MNGPHTLVFTGADKHIADVVGNPLKLWQVSADTVITAPSGKRYHVLESTYEEVGDQPPILTLTVEDAAA